jgi:hypothetical protein
MKLRHEHCANRMNKELCPALKLGLDPDTLKEICKETMGE